MKENRLKREREKLSHVCACEYHWLLIWSGNSGFFAPKKKPSFSLFVSKSISAHTHTHAHARAHVHGREIMQRERFANLNMHSEAITA